MPITPLNISPERHYVLVENSHESTIPGTHLFWGHITADDQPRSFGGYTCDLNKCERYTYDEMITHRDIDCSHLPYNPYPFIHEITDDNLGDYDTIIVPIEYFEDDFKAYVIQKTSNWSRSKRHDAKEVAFA